MNFRERMKVPVSKAEVDIQIELTNRGLTKDMWCQTEICLFRCVPDFFFASHDLCVFIDGPPHAKPRRIDKDNGIDELLRKRGFKVARFPYKGKLSKERLKQICDEIQELVK